MFATDPTLYGVTFPNREASFINPFFGQFQGQQVPYGMFGQQFPLPYAQQSWMTYGQQPWTAYGQQPWTAYGQQLPWMTHGKFVPPVFQSELPFANRYFSQLPYAPYAAGIYNVPQYPRQFPFAY